MDRPAKEIFERLGPGGLLRSLDDLLDPSQLVRLANACGVKYPGLRTQSQSRERLLADIVARSTKTEAARRVTLRALRKETGRAGREWTALTEEEKTRRLGDERFLLSDGNLGLHLFLVASTTNGPDDDSRREHLLGLATSGGPAPATAKASREEARLRKKAQELEKKTRHLDAQLVKSRESQKTFKRDLIQRKGELAEARMLAERLRRELAEAQAAVQSRPAAARNVTAPAEENVAALSQAMRKLAAEQRKLVHRIDRLPAEHPAPVAPAPDALVPVLDAIKELQKDIAGRRRELKKELESQTRRLDELRSQIEKQSAALPAAGRPARRKRAQGDAERIGVFIDVQNMYYAARLLKGKLDFDALLEAAVGDRRLIQATAYVVESKENAQSQFIAMLEQRAIEVKRKTLQVRSDGSMKGDWDMELALDILDAAPRLDVVILVSGDGDFTSLVKRVKSMGPRVEVIAFPRHTAKALVEAADRFQPLDREFMIQAKNVRPIAQKRASSRAEEAPAASPTAPGPEGPRGAAKDAASS